MKVEIVECSLSELQELLSRVPQPVNGSTIIRIVATNNNIKIIQPDPDPNTDLDKGYLLSWLNRIGPAIGPVF